MSKVKSHMKPQERGFLPVETNVAIYTNYNLKSMDTQLQVEYVLIKFRILLYFLESDYT